MIITQEQRFGKIVAREMAKIVRLLAESRQDGKRLDEVERGLLQQLMDAGRVLLQQFIEMAGDGDVGKTWEHDDQRLQRSREPHIKPYRSLFGVLEVCRYVYAREERQKATAPLDAQLGLPAGEQSYVLEDWLGRLTARMSYSEAVTLLKEMGVDTSVRAAETVAARLAACVADFRDQPRLAEEEADEALLVVSADGKGVPMRRSLEQRLQEEHGVSPHKRPCQTSYETAKHRRLRNTAAGRKQMASVGVAYSLAPWPRTPQSLMDELHRTAHSPQRPTPRNKRYWAEMTQVSEADVSPGGPRLFQALRRELLARDPKHAKPWVCLLDGQSSLWTLQKQYLPEAIGILDLYHVTEKLWQAAYDFHPEASAAAEQFVDRYLNMLLEGKVGCVAGVFRRFLQQHSRHKQKTKGLKEAIHYFAVNRKAMCYDVYLAAGYPIGSGVVEGACRHVVKDRLEQTGMRWNIEGAQAVLDLRTTNLNDEWPAFLDYRIQIEQQRLYGHAA